MTDLDIVDPNEELNALKERATLLGIKFSNNIGVDTLRTKVNAKLEEGRLASEATANKVALRKTVKDEELKLVRIRLSVMNPMKKTWRGEVFTVANSVIGTVKKFVPFGPNFYSNGYHVPNCIYKMLRDRTFLNISTVEKNGRITTQTEFLPEFSITVLPPLTKEELEELAAAQAAGNRIGD
jgi:hypothetical protein